MSVLRAREFEFAFSLNKQSAIGTGIAAAQINKKLPQRGFTPSTQEFPDQVSDRNWYGKGHSFATFKDNIDQRLIIPSREYSMTPLSALFGGAFVLGSLASSQPSSGGAPTVYDHSFTFQVPSTNPNCINTSFIEKMGGEYQNLISGAVINSFSVKAQRNDHVVLGWEGFARKMAANATAMPSLVSQSFFKLLKADIRFGASGGGYATNISTEVLSLDFKMTQNAKGWWLPGGASSEENLLSKALIGDQACSGSLVCFIDSTRRNLFLNDTECEIKIRFMGDAIGSTGYFNEAQLTIPHVKISAEALSEIDSTTAYTFTFSEATVFKGATDPYLTWLVRSATGATELLVSA